MSVRIVQWTPEVVDLLLEAISQFNVLFYPYSLLIPIASIIITLILLYHNWKQPGVKKSGYLKAFLALLYVYSGLTIIALIGIMELAFAIAGAIGMWSISLLLLLDIYWKKTIFHLTLESYPLTRALGLILMILGLTVYPLVEILTGHSWLEMVLFTAECPTTIFVIGLYIAAVPETNKLLLAIVSVNAIYTRGAVALAGFYTDILYALAGLAGLFILLLFWRKIKLFPLKRK